MGERQLKFLEFVPLILYFTFVRAADADSVGRQWEIAFFVGGVLSGATLFILMRRKTYILNRILLGAHLFLISGAVAVILRFTPLLDIYLRFNPVPLFVWVIAVGVAATLFSPHGFIGAPDPDRKRNTSKSALLLAAATLALGISWFFMGNIFYTDILPFIGLFMAQDWLQSRTTGAPG